jgi:hypothetical protein
MEILLILKHPTKKITNTLNMGDYFRFSSVFIKKNNQIEFFFKKKPKPGQTYRFRFGFLGQKLVQTSLAQFSGFLGFSSVFFGLARFGSIFPVFTYKTETEPAGFFKILIGLIGFFSVWFFRLFFF